MSGEGPGAHEGAEALHPEALAWTTLLARWMDLAHASVAIPDDADGPRWRASVAGVVNLQAVTFALADLGSLAGADRPYALDRAAILIRENAAHLEQTWAGASLPTSLREIIDDADVALATTERLHERSGKAAPLPDPPPAGGSEQT